MLALHWYGVGKGDEVIIPAYTYAATALVVMHLGAVPVMVDAGKDFTLSIKDVKTRITSRTKAIIPVDVAGWPCDYDELMSLVKEEEVRKLFVFNSENQARLGRILVLSDAAHSIGALYKGQPVATQADLTVFSFHAVKNVTTAEGGAICINLPAPFQKQEVYDTLRLWSLNGQTKDAMSKTMGAGWRYDIVHPGFKINMPDLCAAVGLAQLRKYNDSLLPQRRRVFMRYNELLKNRTWALLPMGTNSTKVSSYHVYALRIAGCTESERDQIIDLVLSQGVSVNVHFQPLPILSLFRSRGYRIEEYPVAYDLYANEISLPIYASLSDHMVDVVVSVLVASVESVLKSKTNEQRIQ
jgi:dTDP-4-amino-4,6-dideoxygalactose transaminase